LVHRRHQQSRHANHQQNGQGNQDLFHSVTATVRPAISRCKSETRASGGTTGSGMA
jgi:hypothetical protein